MRYSPAHGVLSRRSRETVRSMRGRAAEVSGIESSHCPFRHAISASAKRVLRCRRGSPAASVAARAAVRLLMLVSGVCSARRKVCMVGFIAIRF